MAHYIPDHKLKKAKELISNLDDSTENELIKYYIQKDKETIEKQRKQLNEYQDWFKKLNNFLPNTTIYK